MSTGKKRPNISFDTMFVWFGMKFEAVICQKPLWAESSPPRSLEGTKKPGLLRVKVDECKYFTQCDYYMAKMREMIYQALHIFVSPCRQEGKQTY